MIFRSKPTQTAVAAISGLLLGILSAFLLSYAFAVSVPAWLLTGENTAIVLRLWDMTMAYLLAVGVPTFIVGLVLFKWLAKAKWSNCLAFIAGFLVHVHLVAPLLAGNAIFIPAASDMAWYGALFGSVVLGAVIALLLADRFTDDSGMHSDAVESHLA